MKLKKEHLSNILLGVLVVMALVLGFTLVSNGGDEKEELTAGITPSPSNRDFTDDEKAVLITPSPEATDEEKQRHFELAARLAISTNELDLSGCEANPLVFKTTAKEEIKVVNNDDIPHEMIFGPDKRHTIPAGGSARLADLFEQGPGLYGYGCDASPSAAGLFFVTE